MGVEGDNPVPCSLRAQLWNSPVRQELEKNEGVFIQNKILILVLRVFFSNDITVVLICLVMGRILLTSDGVGIFMATLLISIRSIIFFLPIQLLCH